MFLCCAPILHENDLKNRLHSRNRRYKILWIVLNKTSDFRRSCFSRNIIFSTLHCGMLNSISVSAPSPRELAFFRRKNDWGSLQIHIKSTLQSLRVAVGNSPPFTQGRLKMRLSVNLILYEICCGQGQALSLRVATIF